MAAKKKTPQTPRETLLTIRAEVEGIKKKAYPSNLSTLAEAFLLFIDLILGNSPSLE